MSNPYVYHQPRVTGTIEENIPLSTKLILQQADAYGVKWQVLPGTKIFKLEYQGKSKYFRYQISSETSFIGYNAVLDKWETKVLLQAAGVSSPKGFKVTSTDSQEYLLEVFHALQKPLVVKPSHGFRGEDVFMSIDTEEKYLSAIKACLAYSTIPDSGVMVEETFVGKEHRLLTSRKKLLAALNREPANVVGDGQKTVEQLIAEKNSDPRRGKTLDFALFIIDIDDDLKETLKLQNVDLNYVPKPEEKIFLRRVSNIAKGGDSIDVTDLIHPSVAEIAVKAVNAIPELDFAGVDFMTKDITKPHGPDDYVIIEINSSPGLCIHELPFNGKPRHTDREFLFIMFPELEAKAI